MLDDDTRARVIELAKTYAAIVSSQNGGAELAFAAFRKAFPSFTEESETLFASTLLREFTLRQDAPAKPKRRRIVQVAIAASKLPVPFTYVVAHCDDATLWAMEDDHGWTRLPDIPQDEDVTATGVRDESEEG